MPRPPRVPLSHTRHEHPWHTHTRPHTHMDIGALIAKEVLEYIGDAWIGIEIEKKDRDDELLDYTVRITSNRDCKIVTDFRITMERYLKSWTENEDGTHTRTEYNEAKMRKARRQVFRMNRFIGRLGSFRLPDDTMFIVRTKRSSRAYFTKMPTETEFGDYVKLFTTSHDILIKDVSVIRCTMLTLRRILN